MQIPASEHFTTIRLDNAFNTQRQLLPEALRTPHHMADTYEGVLYHGIPFELGAENAQNVVHLHDQPVPIELGGVQATYFLFLHAVENIITNYRDGLADTDMIGNDLGQVVSNYCVQYDDGTREPLPILHGFPVRTVFPALEGNKWVKWLVEIEVS